MTIQDDLHRDYDQLAKDLTARFGTTFTIDSTGGGFYALAASIENGYLLITNGNGDGLQDRQQMEGWGIGVHIDGDQKVYLRKPEPRGLLIITDDDVLATEMGDTIAQALRALTFTPGTKVRDRQRPNDGVGTITEFPAIDPDGFANIDMAEVQWDADTIEIEALYDLI